MPRRSAREQESSEEEFEAQPPLRSKRRGGVTRDTPPKKTRTRDRLRSAELGTPNLRSTRSASQSTVIRTPNTGDVDTGKRRQTAVRTGGRPPTAADAAAGRQDRAPRATQQQPVVEIVRRTRQRLRVESSEELELEEDVDLESEEQSEPPRRTRTSRAAPTAVDDDDDDDDIVLLPSDEEVAMGTAGPGPRTSRNRRNRNLQPVPQPSPRVFRNIMREEAPQTSQMESIEDPDSSPQSSPPPETQGRRPRKSHLAVVDGVEMQIIDDDDDEMDEETQPPAASSAEDYTCPIEGCDVSYKTSDELADHIQTHVNLYRTKSTSKDATPGPARGSADRSSKVRSRSSSSERREQLKTQNFLTDELVKTRAQLEKATEELQRLKAEKGKSTSSKSLTDARVEFAKQLADAEAAFEEKLKAAKQEQADALENAQDELVITREQLQKHKEESDELQAMVKATEVELLNRQKTIEDLEAKLKAAGEDPEGAAATGTALTLPPDAPLEDQLKERDDVIAALRKEVKSKKKALKSTKSDLSFVREQYEVASSSAVQEVNRAKELEAQVTKLREQLTLGLKQRDLINAASMERLTKDAEQARHQLNLLLEQSRRTDDTIRRKAAQHHQLSKSNHDLEVDLHKERSRAHDLSKRNDDLVAQISELRGRLMGAFDKIEDEDSGSDDDVPAPAPALPMPTLVPDDKPVPVAVSDATLAEAPLWQCKWLVGERMCGLYYDTREELDAHGQTSHVCALGPS